MSLRHYCRKGLFQLGTELTSDLKAPAAMHTGAERISGWPPELKSIMLDKPVSRCGQKAVRERLGVLWPGLGVMPNRYSPLRSHTLWSCPSCQCPTPEFPVEWEDMQIEPLSSWKATQPQPCSCGTRVQPGIPSCCQSLLRTEHRPLTMGVSSAGFSLLLFYDVVYKALETLTM